MGEDGWTGMSRQGMIGPWGASRQATIQYSCLPACSPRAVFVLGTRACFAKRQRRYTRMYALNIDGSKILGFVPLSLLVMCLVSCGLSTNATPSGTATGTVTATCTANHFKAATGTIQSIAGTSFILKDAQGKSVQASYSNQTRFQREMAVTSAALQEGTFVSVVVNQSSNTTYTATLVTLLANRGNGSGSGRSFGGTGQSRNSTCLRSRSG